MSVVKNIEIENQNYDIYGKNLQNVTWQEYEAIEDKNDDKAYFITDVPPSEQKKTAVKPLPTGSISTVNDAASLPLNALKVSVEAWQEGSGDPSPSNIRPIHGWDSGEIGVVGKNWAHDVVYTNAKQKYATAIYAKYHLVAGKTYVISFMTENTDIAIYRENPAVLGFGALSEYAFVCDGTKKSMYGVASETADIEAYIMKRANDTSDTGCGLCSEFMIEEVASGVTTPTTYEPYQGKQYTLDFPQTIYGAEWDVVGGELKQTQKHLVVPSNITVYANPTGWNPNYPSYYFYISELGITSNKITCVSNAMKGVSREALQSVNIPLACAIAGGGHEIDFTANVSTVAEAKQLLIDNGVEFLYERATPTTIQLSPLSIRLLENTSNIYADCGKILEGEYFGNNTNQIRVNDEIIAGGNSVTFAAESKYAEHAEVAEVANNIQNIDYDDYDAIVDKDNDIAYIVNDVPSSESGSNYFKDLPTGTISTVNDAAELPLNALKVSVDAQQDLHGYDHPWAGGAGKNKLVTLLNRIKNANSGATWDGNVATINGLTFTIEGDNDGNVTRIKVNGTTTANTVFAITRTPEDDMTLPLGSYTLSGCPSGGSNSTYYVGINHGSNYSDRVTYGYDTGNGMTFNNVSDTDYIGCWIYVVNNVNISNKEFNPMVRESSQSSTFEPYSNICPIEGWDSGEINIVGKNWYNENTSTEGYYIAEDGTVTPNINSQYSDYIDIKKDIDYTFSCPEIGVGNNIRVHGYDLNHNWIEQVTVYTAVSHSDSFTFTVNNSDISCVRISFPRYAPNVQVEKGNQATTYEPYQGKQYTLEFPQTIYGAEWDVVDGELGLKITDGFAEYDGSEAWEQDAINYYSLKVNLPTAWASDVFGQSNEYKYNGATSGSSGMSQEGMYWWYNNSILHVPDYRYLMIRDDNQNSLADFKQFLTQNPLQVRYKLATPTYVTLTGLSIRLLEGTDNLYADCGEVIEGEYCTNTSNQLCINDKVVSGDRMVPQSLVSKYSDYSTHADKADDSTHADIADNACTFSVDENGLLTISLVSGDSNNSLSSTRSVKSTTTLPPEEEIKDESVEEKPLENESGITDETENEPSVEEEKDNDEGGEETPSEQNMR